MKPGGAAVMRLRRRSLHGRSALTANYPHQHQVTVTAGGGGVMQQLKHNLPKSLRLKLKIKDPIPPSSSAVTCGVREVVGVSGVHRPSSDGAEESGVLMMRSDIMRSSV